MLCYVDFVYLLRGFCLFVVIVTFIAASNKQTAPDRTLDLFSFFVISTTLVYCLKTICHLHKARICLTGLGQLCSRVCFDLLVERISFVCNH